MFLGQVLFPRHFQIIAGVPLSKVLTCSDNSASVFSGVCCRMAHTAQTSVENVISAVGVFLPLQCW